MVDKIQKIREWVKARLDENASKKSLPQFYGMMEEDARFLDFIDSLQEEPVSEDLNTAAKEYANNITKKIGYRLQLRRAVCFGANWQKEQMIKNAVECEYFDGSLFCNDLREKYRDCDKVKIVIVKSE